YRTTMGGTNGYVTADGRYFIAGDLFEVASRRNLTEDVRKVSRLEMLTKIQDSDTILFAPPKPQFVVTVFTDVECGYCRKLHSEVAKFNELGIGFRYVAYPRSGPGSESWHTMEAVWCSRDRKDAITRAKRGEKIEQVAGCASNPIAAQYALGR